MSRAFLGNSAEYIRFWGDERFQGMHWVPKNRPGFQMIPVEKDSPRDSPDYYCLGTPVGILLEILHQLSLVVFPIYLQGFMHPRSLAAFLNHEQYVR